MEKLSIELDRLTGVKTEVNFDEEQIAVHQSLDLSPLTDYTNALRNSDEYSREGIKKGFFHVATIDPITQIELLQMGIDIYKCSARELIAGVKRLHKDQLLTTRKQV